MVNSIVKTHRHAVNWDSEIQRMQGILPQSRIFLNGTGLTSNPVFCHYILVFLAQHSILWFRDLEGNRYTSVLKVQLRKLFNLKRLRESDLSFFFFLLLFLLWDYQDTQDIGLLCRLTRTHFLSI